MVAFYTMLAGVGVTNLVTTFTHSLGIAPALLKARIGMHQVVLTATAPLQIVTIGTNIITVALGVGTLTTCDIEVFQNHSIIS